MLRGLYLITPQTDDDAKLLGDVSKALDAGVAVLQYRDKASGPAQRTDRALALQALCQEHNTLFLINDDTELCTAIGADGVHLGAADESIANARIRLGDKIIGASCYADLALAEHALSAGADYIAFGCCYPSLSKPTATPCPHSIICEAAKKWQQSIVAIGGITADNGQSLLTAGADALAVVSAVFEHPDIGAACKQLNRLFEQ